MKRDTLTKEEKEQAAEWASDGSWISDRKYLDDPDYISCVRDILEHPVFQSMDQYIQHGNTTCKEHCIPVSYLSYCICRRWGWDARGAARAGLLHDLFLYDWHIYARESGDHFHGYTHPRKALMNAQKYFTLTEDEKNMILCHMWPLTLRPPKTKAGMAIMCADKICSLSEIFRRMRSNHELLE